MVCPKCGGKLETIPQSGIDVDRCEDCGGLWFDMLEAERLRTKGTGNAIDTGDSARGSELNQQGDVDCPRCKTRMIRMVDIEQHHIWYESCPVCYGKWFDAGEYRDLTEQTVIDFFRSLFTGERP